MRSPENLAPAGRSSRRPVFRVALVVLGLLAGVILVEACFRIVRPAPRRQMIRSWYCLRSLGGVPIWGCEDQDHMDRHNRECAEKHPERTIVQFYGSSVSFGSGLPAREAFSTALNARLNEVRPTPGYCVMNFAEPGFTFEQKLAVARREVPRFKPALIMWEDWAEWFDFTLIGDTAYGTYGLRVRPDGFIGLPYVPDPLNRFLFLNSRFYEYAALTFPEPADEEPSQDSPEIHDANVLVARRLPQVPELARANGAKLVMYLAPPLNRPFSEIVADPPGWHRVLLEFARSRGIPAYLLQKELIDSDYMDLRMDDCCHYNAAGHRALVPVMERIILEQIEGVPGGH